MGSLYVSRCTNWMYEHVYSSSVVHVMELIPFEMPFLLQPVKGMEFMNNECSLLMFLIIFGSTMMFMLVAVLITAYVSRLKNREEDI
jgi:hypothetical protein